MRSLARGSKRVARKKRHRGGAYTYSGTNRPISHLDFGLYLCLVPDLDQIGLDPDLYPYLVPDLGLCLYPVLDLDPCLVPDPGLGRYPYLCLALDPGLYLVPDLDRTVLDPGPDPYLVPDPGLGLYPFRHLGLVIDLVFDRRHPVAQLSVKELRLHRSCRLFFRIRLRRRRRMPIPLNDTSMFSFARSYSECLDTHEIELEHACSKLKTPLPASSS